MNLRPVTPRAGICGFSWAAERHVELLRFSQQNLLIKRRSHALGDRLVESGRRLARSNVSSCAWRLAGALDHWLALAGVHWMSSRHLYNGLVDLPTRSRCSVVTFVALWKALAFPLVVRRVLVAFVCVLAPVPSRRMRLLRPRASIDVSAALDTTRLHFMHF